MKIYILTIALTISCSSFALLLGPMDPGWGDHSRYNLPSSSQKTATVDLNETLAQHRLATLAHSSSSPKSLTEKTEKKELKTDTQKVE